MLAYVSDWSTGVPLFASLLARGSPVSCVWVRRVWWEPRGARLPTEILTEDPSMATKTVFPSFSLRSTCTFKL